jgi:hypothetical protein
MDRWTALSLLLVSLSVLACDAPGATPATAQVETSSALVRAGAIEGDGAPAASASTPARSIYSIVPD